MRTLLIAGSVVLSLAGSVPMTVQTLRGIAKPRAVSWGLWAGIDTIAGAAALAAHQLPAAVFALACSAECVLVAVLALRTPPAERDQPVVVPLPGGLRVRLDLVCLAGGLAGLVLLAAVRTPGPALAATVVTDLIAYIPTLVHAWQSPDEEIASSYAMYAAAAGLTLAAAAMAGDIRVFTAIAYAGYLLVADGAGACVILARRRAARARMPQNAAVQTVPSCRPPVAHHDPLGRELD